MTQPDAKRDETAAVPGGRRERRKAATRASISEAALELFLERGFDAVSIKRIAEHADVAVATVFAHFSGKEALVFDADDDVAESLIAAVERRDPDTHVLDALHGWFTHNRPDTERNTPHLRAFRQLVATTPALVDYWRSQWRDRTTVVAHAIARTTDINAEVAHLLTTLVIEGYLLASDNDHSEHTLTLLFHILRTGMASLDTGGVGFNSSTPDDHE